MQAHGQQVVVAEPPGALDRLLPERQPCLGLLSATVVCLGSGLPPASMRGNEDRSALSGCGTLTGCECFPC
jgi:hypothetical protein